MNNSLPLSSASHLVHGSAGRSFVLICLYNSVYDRLQETAVQLPETRTSVIQPQQ